MADKKPQPNPPPKKPQRKNSSWMVKFSISTVNHFYLKVGSQEEEKISDNDSTITPEDIPWFQITKRHRNSMSGKVGDDSVMPLFFGLFELNALLMTNYLYLF